MSAVLKVSLSPHAASSDSVSRVMWTVVLALLPAVLVGLWAFGVSAALVQAVCVGASVLTEWAITRFLMKSPSRISDGSAVITGLLLGMNLPSGIPLWQAVAGSVFAIGIGKMVFGGIGHNPFNPALVGRAFMLASFPAEMTAWPAPGAARWTLLQFGGADRIAAAGGIDAVSGATALGRLAEAANAGPSAGAGASVGSGAPSYLDLFLGNSAGSLGEISALAILAGGLFLLARRVITWESPVFFLGGLALFTGIFWLVDPTRYADPLFHLLAGGAMLGAWFMVTDMVTSPMTRAGRMIFAGGAGLLAGAIRLFGAYPEGVSYAILIFNGLVPLIDRWVKPRRFGTGRAAEVSPLGPDKKEAARG